MNELMLFIDGSVNTKTKIGYGAYLITSSLTIPPGILRSQIKLIRFENTSSSKLELQNLLYALKEIQKITEKVVVYTDSQNIIKLPLRRKRLEENDYYSKKNVKLKNYELYKEFFKITDKLNCEFIKIEGHKPTKQKTQTERIFTLVDRSSRNALRTE